MKVRALSTVLLVAGVALVFAGITSALGISLSGLLATAAAVGGLLYAGGVWFGGKAAPRETAVVFTSDLVIAAGDGRGRSVADLVPAELRGEVVAHCREALAGRSTLRPTVHGAAHRGFEAVPIRADDGSIVCGLLLIGAHLPRPVQHEHLTLAL